MGKHFISVLGTGNYRVAKYCYNDVCFETKFVQEAILSCLFGDKLDDDDKISVFITDEAKEKNWEHENENCLKDILKNKYKNIEIKDKKIPTGKNDDELMSMFETIYNEIEEGDEIYFDITHGLRNIPMFALTIISYSRVLKNVKLGGIYYGAFEVSDKDTGITPIFDMTMYMNILDWTTASELMIKYGNASMIKDVYYEEKKSCPQEMKKSLGKLEKPINSLERFTSCIQTSRGKINDDESSSIQKAYSKFIEKFNAIDEEEKYFVKPVKPLFEKIIESTKEFDNASNLETGLATIEWCIGKGFTQQGLTALEETIKTYVCNKFELDDSKELYRDEISKNVMNFINDLYKSKKVKNEEDFKNKEDFKNDASIIYQRMKDSFKKAIEKDDCIEIVINILKNIDHDIVKISKKVSEIRNNINHFGFQKNDMEYSTLNKNLELYFKEFKKIIAKS